MITARMQAAMIPLPNGKVLVAGGSDGSTVYLSSAELYDPSTGMWSATGSMGAARYGHSITLLPNGKVLVVGGYDGTNELSSAEIYDLATGTWSAAGSTTDARFWHTATLLPQGKVLVTGGFKEPYTIGSSDSLSSAELYDPATNTWSMTGSMRDARTIHTATLLPDGRIMVAGGFGLTGYHATSELFYPGSSMSSTVIASVSGTYPSSGLAVIQPSHSPGLTFTTTRTFFNVSISVSAIPYQGNNTTVYLTTHIGPDTTTAAQLASVHFNIPAASPPGPTSEIYSSTNLTLFSGLTLAPNTYYLTFGEGSSLEGALVLDQPGSAVTVPGITLGKVLYTASRQSYPPASSYVQMNVDPYSYLPIIKITGQ
jgi:WD40 repeat protein